MIATEHGTFSNSVIFIWCWLEATKTMTQRTHFDSERMEQLEMRATFALFLVKIINITDLLI